MVHPLIDFDITTDRNIAIDSGTGNIAFNTHKDAVPDQYFFVISLEAREFVGEDVDAEMVELLSGRIEESVLELPYVATADVKADTIRRDDDTVEFTMRINRDSEFHFGADLSA